jgi:hypothetical protein
MLSCASVYPLNMRIKINAGASKTAPLTTIDLSGIL